MGKLFICILLTLILVQSKYQYEWSYLAGSTTANPAGKYTPAASAYPGGRTATWVKLSATQYLVFGGQGYASTTKGNLNDVWRVDFATSTWTFLGGSQTIDTKGVYNLTNNNPGGRYGSHLGVLQSGSVILFGGLGVDANDGQGELNDVWRIDLSPFKFNYLSGNNTIAPFGVYSGNNAAPGGRYSSVFVSLKNDSFLLFGGKGYASSGASANLNDVWRYDAGTPGTWKFLKGSTTADPVGVYSGNNAAPGGRFSSAFTDLGNNSILIFGGFGKDSTGSVPVPLNDLWRFDTTTLAWKFLVGSTTGSTSNVYTGTQSPGARQYTTIGVVGSGLILIGGYTRDGSNSYDYNDVWELDLNTLKWAFSSGNTSSVSGVYKNGGYIGGREDFLMSILPNNSIVVFGGTGYAGSGVGALNDVWRAELTCADGFYGSGCANACPCTNGACLNTFNGDGKCISCNTKFFGADCNGVVLCVHGTFTDGLNGAAKCTACESGYWGPYCNNSNTCPVNGIPNDGIDGNGKCKDCKTGFWGPNCENTCSCAQSTCDAGIGGTGQCSILMDRDYLNETKSFADNTLILVPRSLINSTITVQGFLKVTNSILMTNRSTITVNGALNITNSTVVLTDFSLTSYRMNLISGKIIIDLQGSTHNFGLSNEVKFVQYTKAQSSVNMSWVYVINPPKCYNVAAVEDSTGINVKYTLTCFTSFSRLNPTTNSGFAIIASFLLSLLALLI